MKQCTKEQIESVPRILSEEMAEQIKSGNTAAIENCCKQICDPEGVFIKMIDSVSVLKQRIHSEYFRTNPGHFVRKILEFDCSWWIFYGVQMRQ